MKETKLSPETMKKMRSLGWSDLMNDPIVKKELNEEYGAIHHRVSIVFEIYTPSETEGCFKPEVMVVEPIIDLDITYNKPLMNRIRHLFNQIIHLSKFLYNEKFPEENELYK